MHKFSEYKYHLIALFTVAVWGTTFVSSKVLLTQGLTPAEIFFLRFLLAYVCIWPLSGRRLLADSWRDEALLLVGGMSGGSFYFLAENMALEFAPASNVSLLVSTSPIWTALLLSALYRSERMTRRQVAGSVVAFVGVVLVVLNGRFILQLSPKGDLLALAAALCWMIYSLVIKHIGANYPTLFLTRKIFFYGLVTILPVFLIQPFDVSWETLMRPKVWGNLLFLGVVASMLCYVMWNAVINKLGAVRTTNYVYFVPLVTIVAAASLIGERITLPALAGAALILLGMWQAEKK